MDSAIAQNLSPRVEEAIKKVLGNEIDELDGPTFDPVDFINKKFPDERSLDGLDKAIGSYDAEIKHLDNSILETVREQSTAGTVAAKDLADAKDSIGDLHAKIIEIKKKAEASEAMVQDICKDIKQLDVAKRHLTNTILTLARLKTLTSAVQQLQSHAGRRSYEEAAPLLEAAIQLFTHFADYAKVGKISELAGQVEGIRNELREMISEDFDILIDSATPSDMSFQDSVAKAGGSGTGAGSDLPPERVLTLDELKGGRSGDDSDGARVLSEDNVVQLRAACECVDALGPAVRKSLLKTFNRKQLKGYQRIFARGSDIGDSLDGIDKRYAWFRKSLGLIEDKYGKILPKRWRVLHRLCIEFLEATRIDVDRILGQFDPPSSAPPELLLRALLKTIAFEKEMAKRFESDLGGANRRKGDDDDEDGGGRRGGAGGAGIGGDDEEEEVWDDSAPLYNDKGELVDPSIAEGIRLKYKRKKEFEERKLKEQERKAARAEQRRVIASLAGVDTSSSARGGAAGSASSSGPVSVGRATIDEEIAALPKICEPGNGMLSAAFGPYMASYVKFERANIDNAVSATNAEDGNKPEAHVSLLRSATQLFAQARNAVTRCVQLSTGQTLYDLYKEIADSMASYASQLIDRMPKPTQANAASLPGDTYQVTEAEAPKIVDAICLIINTSEYCAETVPKFAESVQKVLDPAYKEHVQPESTQEVFYALTAHALKTLSGVVACVLDQPLSKLSKTDWSRLSEVGDHSSYTADMSRSIKPLFPIARKRLEDAPFRQFCDKFVRAFLVRYQASIYRCKKVGETGAQQLLLDAQAIRSMLLLAPACRPASDKYLAAIVSDKPIGDDIDIEEAASGSGDGDDGDYLSSSKQYGPASVPAVYTKFVSKEVPRVELLLKIISTPRERFGDTIKALWAEASEPELTRVMDLKGMTKKEQQDVLVSLGRIRPGALAGMGMGMNMGMGNINMGSLAAGLSMGLGSTNTSGAAGGGAAASANAPAPFGAAAPGAGSASGGATASGIGASMGAAAAKVGKMTNVANLFGKSKK